MTKPNVDEYGFAIDPESDTTSTTKDNKDTNNGSNAWGIILVVAMILYLCSVPVAGYIAWQLLCY